MSLHLFVSVRHTSQLGYHQNLFSHSCLLDVPIQSWQQLIMNHTCHICDTSSIGDCWIVCWIVTLPKQLETYLPVVREL